MFCRNCGKQIENGTLCQDCLTLLEEAKKENDILNGQTITAVDGEEPIKQVPVSPVFVSSPVTPVTQTPSVNYISSKKGVWAVILSVIGVMLQFVCLSMSIETLAMQASGLPVDGSIDILMSILLSPPTILGLIFGIQSLISFFKNKRNGKKTWANLILGAIAIEISFVALVVFFLVFLYTIIGASIAITYI